jgi:hypothetical protein
MRLLHKIDGYFVQTVERSRRNDDAARDLHSALLSVHAASVTVASAVFSLPLPHHRYPSPRASSLLGRDEWLQSDKDQEQEHAN